jgi:parvulin-like peptidyl-prolyl isomerase
MLSLYRLSAAIVIFTTFNTGWAQVPKPPAPKPAAAAPAAVASKDDAVPAQLPDAIFPAAVARVNGKAILGRDLDRLVKTELGSIGSPTWASLRPEYRQELVSKYLGTLVATELMYQKATTDGTKATDTEIQAEFGRIAKTYPNDTEMNTALAKQGLDRAAVLKALEKELTVNKFVTENIAKKITITSDELSKYYAGHQEEFRHPDMVRTSHILIAVPESAKEEQDAAAKKKADDILARAKKGEDFAKLAKEFSADSSKDQGGDIGFVTEGDTAPEYEFVAFKLAVGAISDETVRTQFGYHIIKVTEKRKAGISTLEEAKSELTDFLKNQKVQEETGKIVEGLRKDAKIEVLLPASLLQTGSPH